MKEDIKALGLTEEDFQALLGDIKKRREKYRESLDEEKKEDKIMDKNYYDYVLEKNITQREADTDGIYIISNYLGPVTTLDTIKSCDCIIHSLTISANFWLSSLSRFKCFGFKPWKLITSSTLIHIVYHII